MHFSRFRLFRIKLRQKCYFQNLDEIYDLDESGKITAVDCSDWMEKHGRVMEPDGIRLMIDAFDENDDGQIRKIKKYQN